MINFRNILKPDLQSEILRLFFSCILTFVIFAGCSEQKQQNEERIIIGIESDVQSLNPMYAFSLFEGNLIDLLYLKPADEVWNDSLGMIEFRPMLAEKWEWNEHKNILKLFLRNDIYWSDGTSISTDDIVFTFDVYSNPKVESRFFGQFENFYTIDGLQIDIEKTFNIISPTLLEIYFKKDSNPTLLDVNLEIVPKHIWSKIKLEEFPQASQNFEPITSGAYRLNKWERESTISLVVDSSSFLYNPESITEIVFKILPDYKSRITHLKTGAIDVLDNVKGEDIEELRSTGKLNIHSIRGRDYDYIGWNHIDPHDYKNSIETPNKLFSSPTIRKALTIAINRKEIVDSYMGEFGELCKGPVSPMYKSYYDVNLPSDEYNPAKAKKILKSTGWEDRDGDGILENGNLEFSFDLYIGTGNPRRNYIATLIKNNLKAVGVEVKIQTLEMGAFVERLMSREFDAWIAGWTIPIPIDLNPYWNSDPEVGFLNFSSYKNASKDEILNKLQGRINESERKNLYLEIQKVFYEDEPVTFLYWFDNIITYNSRIKEINFSMLGIYQDALEWRLK